MKKLLTLLFIMCSFGAFAQTDTLVTNTVTLDGSGSNDNLNPNGGIVKYQWTQVSGSNTAVLTNATTSIATVTLSVAGTYQYSLTVTNKAGLSDTQSIQFTVIAGDMKPTAIIKVLPLIKLPPQK